MLLWASGITYCINLGLGTVAICNVASPPSFYPLQVFDQAVIPGEMSVLRSGPVICPLRPASVAERLTNDASTQTVDASGETIETSLQDSQRLLQAATILSSLIGSSFSDATLSCLSTVQDYFGTVGPLLVEALQIRGEAQLQVAD